MMIAAKNLTHSFGETKALDGITFSVEEGNIYGLIGADGAGKTTLMRLVVGLYERQEGELLTLGLDSNVGIEALRREVAYMPQKFGLYEDLTVQENLELFASLKELPKDEWESQFKHYLEMTGMNAFRNRLAGKLSGGMKQKLGIACALLGSPKLLILDEPSVGVDPISRRELIALIRQAAKLGTTVFWSTAYLDEAFYFDQILVLHEGRLIYNGTPYGVSDTQSGFEAAVIELMGGYQTSDLTYEFREDLPDLEYTVEADQLVKKYGNFYAVKDNTFHIKKGEIFGLLGPNGAGKSTSFKMMCGLIKTTSGTAKIMGVDMQKNASLAKSYLGYMAQKFSLYGDLTVRANLTFFASVYGIPKEEVPERVEEIMKQFDLLPFAEQRAHELPLGFKQRLAFGAAIIHRPAILFLDEATSGVDPVSRDVFWQEIKFLASKGVTVLVTTHFMDEAEYCDRISLFYKGKSIAIGAPKELKERVQVSTMEDAFIALIQEYEAKEG